MNTLPPGADDMLPPDDDLLAGEYVLGVLDADARRRVQARIAAEPRFARRVGEWEERLSPWLADAPPVAPGAHVWPRVRARLGWPAVAAARPGLWQSTAFWRAVAGLATAAGVAAVVVALRLSVPTVPDAPDTIAQATPVTQAGPRPVTVLADDAGRTGWLATFDRDGSRVLMIPVPRAAEPDGRVPELWLIPAGGAPVSLGFVSGERAHTVAIPAAMRAAVVVGATLAVTLEPGEGLPHAAPSGPVVASGGIADI